MNTFEIGDIVYWDSFGLEKPLLIVDIQTWATVVVLATGEKIEFYIGNLRTWEQMQPW